ncbi:S-layer homology domain-containing protein [Sporosarcina cyprini]|uniref:S-layer homology domain-containing protein n=1 Tax=Sporosarcina cyprini TaxID=2910523 RepID=UPI001EE06246|nr:S-layer homology domain-containing protein [Sporosarcina cyprini]MCG3088358.1 S-layer homology domain-containing protein [Sporosarcina cyprini]
MKKNKIVSMVAAAAILVPALIVPIRAEADVINPFTDVSKNSPYYELIHEMRDRHIISGYENGEFRPTEVITRKHAAALVNRAVKLPATKKFVPFKDVSPKNAFYNDIKKLQQAGIYEPDAKGNLNPNEPITRAEMAKVLTIAFDLKVKVNLDFMDVPKTHPSSKYIHALNSNGITTGNYGFYEPDKPVTRMHYAVFLQRLLHMNDPIDPSEPAQRIRGQLAKFSPEQLESDPTMVAEAMSSMLHQKVTMSPSDYLILDELEDGWREVYWAGNSFGQMAEENILYLKRFAKKDSMEEAILNKWLQGDFSQVIKDYEDLQYIYNQEYSNCTICDRNYNIRTNRAEEYFVRTLFGEEGLQRHREQWGAK